MEVQCLIQHVGKYLKINRGREHFDCYSVAQNYSTPGYIRDFNRQYWRNHVISRLLFIFFALAKNVQFQSFFKKVQS